MASVLTSITIDRSPADVWDDVQDISSHTSWMQDAESIEFTSDSREGVGTAFDCVTKVGPIRLTDKMEITSWEDERRMGVRHVGIVTGVGEFTLHPVGASATEFRWEEDLTFPIWLGGRLGEFVGKYVLSFIWKGNLRRLKARIEAQPPSVDPTA